MRHRAVAEPETVEVLFEKFQTRARQNPELWQRLIKATDRAHTRYREVNSADARGFYHGLLTGYAVALKALQGKMTRPRLS
jgi:hypothetical protein